MMRVLISPGTYDCLNLGDLAMLQVAAARLHRLGACRVGILTDDQTSLTRHVSEVDAVAVSGRQIWLSDRYLLGGVHDTLPHFAGDMVRRTKRRLRRTAPGLVHQLKHLKIRMTPGAAADRLPLDAFLDAITNAGIVMIAGQGTISDKFPGHAHAVLDTLEMAKSLGKFTFMSGQGIGPLANPHLIRRAREVLPHVDRIALRERMLGPSLLVEDLGVSQSQVVVTGDDAIELAYDERPKLLGEHLGINLRIGGPAGTEDEVIDALRRVLQQFDHSRRVAFVSAPIALHRDARDPETIRRILQPWASMACDDADPSSAVDLIRRIGTCRVMLTGAYHAAVFALSQGVPTICVYANDYYRAKFAGLRDLFGDGCTPQELNCPDAESKLLAVLQETWEAADALRPALLSAARAQMVCGEANYRDVLNHVTQKEGRVMEALRYA